ILSQGNWVHLLCETQIFRFGWYKDPNTDGAFSLAVSRGCVNHRSCVPVGNTAYMLDDLGCHAYSGNDDYSLSAAIDDLFRSQPFGPYRINWRARNFFHDLYCPADGLVRWFVCLDG